MRTGLELIGKPIYSITDGRYVGTVKDLYLDEDLRKVQCIHLGLQGMHSRGSIIIRREDVEVLGIDAILIKDSNVLIERGELIDSSTMIRREALKLREIFTAGGTRVAKIRDVILDDELHIAGFKLGRVYIEGPIAKRGSIARVSILENHSRNGKIIIDFSIAEDQDLRVASYT